MMVVCTDEGAERVTDLADVMNGLDCRGVAKAKRRAHVFFHYRRDLVGTA
jgi:hypothetical protein